MGFLILLPVFIKAQESKIVQVKGIITNYHNEVLPYVFIYDEYAKKGYLATEHGEFDIFTTRGTTLIFTHIGYKRDKFVIPSVGKTDILFLKLKMITDTLKLPEVVVFPWKTLKQFIHVAVTTKIPEDEVSRVEKRFDEIRYQAMHPSDDEIIPSPEKSYRLTVNKRAAESYWKGQTQPMPIFDLMAWQKFFQYLKEGKFKNQNKNKEQE